VRGRLTAAGAEVVAVHGPGPRAADDQLRAALCRGVDVVVALGGDGTVALALQHLVGTGVPLGVVPAGSGDDVARSLALPRSPVAACDAVLDGSWAAVDVGRSDGLSDGRPGGRWFLSVLAAGFDATVAARARALHRPRGPARYPAAAVAALAQRGPRAYRLDLDGRTVEEEALLLALGSGSSYGGGLRICAGADPYDGLLDVTLVRPLGLARLAALLPRLYAGRHTGHPAVRTHRARQVVVQQVAPARPHPGAWADGEPAGSLPVTVRAVPAAVRVLGAVRPGT
jgi:diacylglycerol kinase (ATP)